MSQCTVTIETPRIPGKLTYRFSQCPNKATVEVEIISNGGKEKMCDECFKAFEIDCGEPYTKTELEASDDVK